MRPEGPGWPPAAAKAGPSRGHQARPADPAGNTEPGRRPEPPPAPSQGHQEAHLHAGGSGLGAPRRGLGLEDTPGPRSPSRPRRGAGWGAQAGPREGREPRCWAGRTEAILPRRFQTRTQAGRDTALTAETAAPAEATDAPPPWAPLPSWNLGPRPALPRSQGEPGLPRWEPSGGRRPPPDADPTSQPSPCLRGAHRADARQCLSFNEEPVGVVTLQGPPPVPSPRPEAGWPPGRPPEGSAHSGLEQVLVSRTRIVAAAEAEAAELRSGRRAGTHSRSPSALVGSRQDSQCSGQSSLPFVPDAPQADSTEHSHGVAGLGEQAGATPGPPGRGPAG